MKAQLLFSIGFALAVLGTGRSAFAECDLTREVANLKRDFNSQIQELRADVDTRDQRLQKLSEQLNSLIDRSSDQDISTSCNAHEIELANYDINEGGYFIRGFAELH